MSTGSNKSETAPVATTSVGYCRPPEDTRFKKGVSGNPKGRPKGSLNLANVFARALRERVVINENGQRKTVTKLEAALKQLVNKAAGGDMRALRQLVDLAKDAEIRDNNASSQEPGFGEIDKEVIKGLLERFRPDAHETSLKGQEEEAKTSGNEQS